MRQLSMFSAASAVYDGPGPRQPLEPLAPRRPIAKVHPFERAGLGLAPFRYVGMVHQETSYGQAVIGTIGGIPVTTQPGGSCDFCGHYIVDMFQVESADGKRFKVGCDCIHKVNQVAGSDVVDVDRKKAAIARDEARIALALANLPQAHALSSQPHPTTWRAREGETMAHWCRWTLTHGGRTGRLGAARLVEKALAVRVDD
jgi:hypothetical protein